MIQHTVCFRLKDRSEQSRQKAKEVLLSMTGRVSTAKAITVGTDFLGSERSYDIILQVLLESREALEQYQNDPYHCDVVKTYMHAAREASVAVDCEV